MVMRPTVAWSCQAQLPEASPRQNAFSPELYNYTRSTFRPNHLKPKQPRRILQESAGDAGRDSA